MGMVDPFPHALLLLLRVETTIGEHCDARSDDAVGKRIRELLQSEKDRTYERSSDPMTVPCPIWKAGAS